MTVLLYDNREALDFMTTSSNCFFPGADLRWALDKWVAFSAEVLVKY